MLGLEDDLESDGRERRDGSARRVDEELVGGGCLDLEGHGGVGAEGAEVDIGPALAAELEVDGHLRPRGDFHQLLLALRPFHKLMVRKERRHGESVKRIESGKIELLEIMDEERAAWNLFDIDDKAWNWNCLLILSIISKFNGYLLI